MGSKRKRIPATRSISGPSADVIPQPSSRDASGEDAEDPVLREVSSAKTKQSAESAGGAGEQGQGAKRLRASKTDGAESDDEQEEEGDGSDAAATAVENGMIGDQRIHSNDDVDGKTKGSGKMEAPSQAGLVHPTGYRTDPPPVGRPVRVYADGVFDLFHLGHMRQLEQAKKAFPDVYLVVGVAGDKETHRRKGLTVLSGKERAESVRHCKWVDEVIEDCPWVVTLDFTKKHRIDYVAHDDLPYGADEGDDIYAPIKAAGKFLVTQRTEGVSTTGIITKIVRDYDNYISRQLKRGTSRQELNISWLKKNEIDVKRHLAELRKDISTNWTVAGLELGKDLRQFWQPSRPASPTRAAVKHERSPQPSSSSGLLLTPGSKVGDGAGASSAGGGGSEMARSVSPSGRGAATPSTTTSDFVTGYTLGLIGSVKSWMARSRHSLGGERGPETESPEMSGVEGSPEPSRASASRDEMDTRS